MSEQVLFLFFVRNWSWRSVFCVEYLCVDAGDQSSHVLWVYKEAVVDGACGNDGVDEFYASRVRIISLSISPRNELG